jgi:hypothetical protein
MDSYWDTSKVMPQMMSTADSAWGNLAVFLCYF